MYTIQSYYKFRPLTEIEITEFQDQLNALAAELQVIGLFILGHEGINTTVASQSQSNLGLFAQAVQNKMGMFDIKESVSDKMPFRRFKTVVREEIVTIGNTEIVPEKDLHHHLPPEEFEKALNEPGVVVIDTRNWYETKVGKFKQALDLNIDEFSEFPKAVEDLNLKKDTKVLMYCTGGIRCEKAILEMNRQGFENVFQLQGGILNYFEKTKGEEWDGECFVFDHRVAVKKDLSPSENYGLCPHCGQPSEKKYNCLRCDTVEFVCDACLKIGPHKQTCSKNCAHQYSVNPVKGRKQILEPVTRKSIKARRSAQKNA